ncbi:hypothetical protein RHSIM_Rhsim02G0147600 [Rhododendron simsii]|uniref:Uncharacterized protein n=1 Tax=Rhododendron simsii TaxID=118357 RepID=A0A834LZW1_RHOSS|nr:hypothetical protein RHSIM_Rhsim02G0147600 [Rhododendron simsii]
MVFVLARGPNYNFVSSYLSAVQNELFEVQVMEIKAALQERLFSLLLMESDLQNILSSKFLNCIPFFLQRHHQYQFPDSEMSREENVPTKKKQGKVMLQPNFLATHYKTHYERIRDEKVKRNNEVLESLGVMKIATSMMGSAWYQCANDNGKRGRADQVDDPDYILSNDEDGHGYNSESDDSFEQEDIEITPGGLPAQSHTEPQCGATLISERVTRSTPHPSMESQASVPPSAQPQNEVLPENNGGSGNTMWTELEQLQLRFAQKVQETRGEEYARNNPPTGVNPEQWTSLVTKKWTVPKWLMHDNGGVVLAVTEMYKDTHFNKDTQKWISSESEVLYDQMVQIETEHNAPEGAIPITQEELSIKGLKARSGYVKGLGIRPSSSIRTVNREYVTHLKGKVQEQAEKIQEQDEGIEAANNKIEEQGKTLASYGIS